MASNNNPPFEYAEWFAGKNFTTNWATHNFQTWNTLLSDRRDESLNVLEIGSWEGRSALFFLNYFPHCHLTCIDTFEGSSEHRHGTHREVVQDIEKRFDRNLAGFESRLHFFSIRSGRVLASSISPLPR